MPISPDSDYCLDGLIACLDLTPDLGVAARVGRLDIDALIDQNESLVREIENRVLNWWETEASPEQRGFCSILGMCTISASLRELLWSITGPLAEQYLFSRGAIPGRDIFGAVLEPKTIPYDLLPNIQALRQPIVIQTMIAADAHYVRYIDLMRKQYRRAVRALHDCPIERVIDWSTSSGGRQLLGQSNEPRIPRRVVKQRRKALRRSLRSFNQIVGPDAYQAFISKDGFMINGHLFDYHVRKKYDLLDTVRLPVVPYFLNIHEKGDTTNSLGSGCVYFEDTPVLDQVIALTLHVRDHEPELDLLKTSNWTATDRGKKHDVFRKLTKPSEPALIDVVDPVPFLTTDVSDEDRVADAVPDSRSRIFFDVSRNGRSMSRYRKRIMDCIEPDAMGVIAALANIPLPLYQWMSRQNEFVPSLTNFVTNPVLHECLEQSAQLEFQQ